MFGLRNDKDGLTQFAAASASGKLQKIFRAKRIAGALVFVILLAQHGDRHQVCVRLILADNVAN
jgi:hypothetical protein